jgi:predicted transglutaminase-like cysteine proteinase
MAARRRHGVEVKRGLLVVASIAAAASAAGGDCGPLDLPVDRIAAAPTAYVEFCATNPGHCEMKGPHLLTWDDSVAERLARVNGAVNAEIRFMPDQECIGVEELWRYPVNGIGDCEDFALEKRRRLVTSGVPRAAMTIAIVHHRQLGFSHAVLMVETSQGSFALDNLSDAILCWNRLPYNFESRERPDGQWTRFDQQHWTFSPPGEPMEPR